MFLCPQLHRSFQKLKVSLVLVWGRLLSIMDILALIRKLFLLFIETRNCNLLLTSLQGRSFYLSQYRKKIPYKKRFGDKIILSIQQFTYNEKFIYIKSILNRLKLFKKKIFSNFIQIFIQIFFIYWIFRKHFEFNKVYDLFVENL